MTLDTIQNVSKEELDSFSCGNKDLDNFFKKYAIGNDSNGYGKTFIVRDKNELIGFFTLCSASIKFEEFPSDGTSKLPRYPIPCIRIARLAVQKRKQGNGFGKELLKFAFLRILNVSSTIGIRLIVVDAKETSTTFYEKYGFQKLLNNKLTYYLPIETLKKAIK